jgi:adenine C2-methylase RlmN of 23S rRNA A2503 and tRNA A37
MSYSSDILVIDAEVILKVTGELNIKLKLQLHAIDRWSRISIMHITLHTNARYPLSAIHEACHVPSSAKLEMWRCGSTPG